MRARAKLDIRHRRFDTIAREYVRAVDRAARAERRWKDAIARGQWDRAHELEDQKIAEDRSMHEALLRLREVRTPA